MGRAKANSDNLNLGEHSKLFVWYKGHNPYNKNVVCIIISEDVKNKQYTIKNGKHVFAVKKWEGMVLKSYRYVATNVEMFNSNPYSPCSEYIVRITCGFERKLFEFDKSLYTELYKRFKTKGLVLWIYEYKGKQGVFRFC